jgi:hypothetical protein
LLARILRQIEIDSGEDLVEINAYGTTREALETIFAHGYLSHPSSARAVGDPDPHVQPPPGMRVAPGPENGRPSGVPSPLEAE